MSRFFRGTVHLDPNWGRGGRWEEMNFTHNGGQPFFYLFTTIFKLFRLLINYVAVCKLYTYILSIYVYLYNTLFIKNSQFHKGPQVFTSSSFRLHFRKRGGRGLKPQKTENLKKNLRESCRVGLLGNLNLRENLIKRGANL